MAQADVPRMPGVDPSRRVKYIRSVDQVPNIPESEREKLRKVSEKYVFRANDYYLGLIDWDDPNDPIKQLIIPRTEELNDWGELDASKESLVTVARGVQHKYPHTVLLLCNEVCGAYCRYCFRKRLFMDENDEVTLDVSEGLKYIADNPEVSNVLLTGGDPLLMSTRRLTEIFAALREIPHVRIIRIGSKMPAFDPWRILRDDELQEAFRKYSTPRPPHLPDGPLRPPARAHRRGHRRARLLHPQRGDLRQPVPAHRRGQRRSRGPERALPEAGLGRLPALLPLPGPSDRRERAVRGAHRPGLADLPRRQPDRARAWRGARAS